MVGTLKTKLHKQKKVHQNTNKNAAYLARKHLFAKQKQLRNAVKWCKENGKRGYAAVNSGLFPLIKAYQTINKRLDGHITTGKEKQYCSILTTEEEDSLVLHMRNKNRCFQAINTQEVSDLIMNILEVRKAMCKKFKYRRVEQLSNNAKRALAKRKLSQSFWVRFQAKYKDIIAYKRQGSINIRRAVSCTRQMATKNLDEMAKVLIDANIFSDAVQKAPGKWSGKMDLSRIFNHDETPQFINFGVDGSGSGKVFGCVGKNESCQRILKENRECPTVHPMVSCDGNKVMCQVIFSRKGIDTDMFTEKIENLVVSTTPHGVQDHHSLLSFYRRFNKYLEDAKVQKPVVVLSDGHSSRFNAEVFNYLRKNEIMLFISPPDTTSVTQLLDQVNKSLHEAYRNKKKELYSSTESIGIKDFMYILEEIWPNWISKESLVKAAKRIGITATGLDVDCMQKNKFEQAKALLSQDNVDPTDSLLNVSNVSKSSSLIESPAKCRHGSKEYYKTKLEFAENIINSLINEPIKIEDVPSLLQVQKLPKQTPKAKTRLTQMHGSMFEEEKISIVEQIEKEKAAKAKASNDAKAARSLITETFLKCKFECICNQTPCAAISYKQCSICQKVYKSQCMKNDCKRQGREMLKPVSAASKQCSSKLPPSVVEDESDSSETTEPSDSDMILLDTDSEYLSTDFHAGSTDDSEGDETAVTRRQFREEMLQKVLKEKWSRCGKEKRKRSHSSTSVTCGTATISRSRQSFSRVTKKRKPLPDPIVSSDEQFELTDSDAEFVITTACSKEKKSIVIRC